MGRKWEGCLKVEMGVSGTFSGGYHQAKSAHIGTPLKFWKSEAKYFRISSHSSASRLQSEPIAAVRCRRR